MSKLCTKCGQVIEDNVSICPYCGKEVEHEVKEETNINDIIEISVVNPTDNSTVEGTVPLVMAAPTLDDIKPAEVQTPVEPIVITETPAIVETNTEPVVEAAPVEEEVPPVESDTVKVAPVPEVVPVEEIKIEEQQLVEPVPVVEAAPVEEEVPPVESNTLEASSASEVAPVTEIEVTTTPTVVEEGQKEALEIPAPDVNITTAPVIVETAPNLGDANEILTIVETEVENNSLETISVDATDNALVEEEEVFEIPVMPEPTIGEISSEILGNKYDTEEQINNEKLETKKKLEEEERERKIQEELAKMQTPMERPDLLAGYGESDPNMVVEEPKKKKAKGGKIALVIIIIVAVLALGGGVAWFILSGGLDKLLNKEPEVSYIDPVKTYYDGFNSGDSEKMISSFVSCLSQSDLVSNIVNNSLNTKNQNPNLKITFTETNVEVVNSDDKKHLDKHLLDNCITNVPTITDYKHVFIEQKTKINTDSKDEVSNPEFWVGEIDGKWYIILIQ